VTRAIVGVGQRLSRIGAFARPAEGRTDRRGARELPFPLRGRLESVDHRWCNGAGIPGWHLTGPLRWSRRSAPDARVDSM